MQENVESSDIISKNLLLNYIPKLLSFYYMVFTNYTNARYVIKCSNHSN